MELNAEQVKDRRRRFGAQRLDRCLGMDRERQCPRHVEAWDRDIEHDPGTAPDRDEASHRRDDRGFDRGGIAADPIRLPVGNEDDVRNVFALSSIFEPRGAHVEIVRNGREALEALAKEPKKEIKRPAYPDRAKRP